MKGSHMNPKETVRAFRELNAERLMVVHWGTFRLGDEPVYFPPIDIEREMESAGLSDRLAGGRRPRRESHAFRDGHHRCRKLRLCDANGLPDKPDDLRCRRLPFQRLPEIRRTVESDCNGGNASAGSADMAVLAGCHPIDADSRRGANLATGPHRRTLK